MPLPGRRATPTDAEEPTPDEAVEARLTWLWSTPRSGAELLLGLLAHPLRPDPSAALSFRPPPAQASVEPRIIPIDELCFGGHVAPWPGDAVAVGDRWVPGTLLNLSEGRDPYLLSRGSEGTWREPLRRLGLSRIAYAADRAAAHVRGIGPESPIVVKEAAFSHAADRVMQLMPRSRMIALVRDPRDAAASYLRNPEGFDEEEVPVDEEVRMAAVTRAARIWAMTVDVSTAALDGQDEAFGLRMRFEDLLVEPGRELGKALALIGFDRDAVAIAEAVDLSPVGAHPPDRPPAEQDLGTMPGAWHEDLTGVEVGVVEDIAGPRLAAHGYEPA